MESRPVNRSLMMASMAVLLHCFSMPLSAQLSPGDLSEAHAHLEGLSNCTKCHVLGEKVSNEKCLDCHSEIAARISSNRGFHASADVKEKECAGCHNDHHGRNFQMIRFDTARFDHGLTGYPLQGAHERTDCSGCHKAGFIKDRELSRKSSTYLGLDRSCLSCHTDYHQGTLSGDCTSCHDLNRFRPAPGFDHDDAGFRLLGRHAAVDCKQCHKTTIREGKEMQQFKGIPHNSCTSCHKDIHENKFGQNCAQCHTEVSFHQLRGMTGFDHARTGFTLNGKHRTVSCTSCHKKGYSVQLSHNRCTDCHADYHRGQFITGGNRPDCRVCHSEQGFTPSSYTIERHNTTPFTLSGAHLATPCFDCHRKEDAWSFRGIGRACVDCHRDIHATYLDAKYYPDRSCTTCHRDTRWSEIGFDHSRTGYILEGSHARQSCRSCHFRKDDTGVVVQQFSRSGTSCLNCHEDNHHNQFETGGTSCLQCHDYFDWKAGLFNHSRTAFPLQGKHRDVACAKCHPKAEDAGQLYTLYKLKTFTCESCH